MYFSCVNKALLLSCLVITTAQTASAFSPSLSSGQGTTVCIGSESVSTPPLKDLAPVKDIDGVFIPYRANSEESSSHRDISLPPLKSSRTEIPDLPFHKARLPVDYRNKLAITVKINILVTT